MLPRDPSIRLSARRSGFTLIEVMFCMIIFSMMLLVFAAVFPFAIKESLFSNNYAEAAMIAQHKIDQIRRTAWGNLSLAGNVTAPSSPNLLSLGIVDTCSSDGAGGFSCPFTNIDDIANNGNNIGYFPAGSTATVSIDPDNGSGVPVNSVANVTVLINWSGAGMPPGNYTAVAKIVETPHQ